LRGKQQEALRSEYRHLNEELAQRTQAEVFAIARKALADLAGESLEARMTEAFVQHMRDLNSDEKARLAAMFKSPYQAAQVRSAFELTPAQHTAIEEVIKETLSATASVRFEVIPNLVSGLELVVQGRKVAWSIAEHLSSLEKDVNELLKGQRKAE